ncbi:DUF3488 and transglutaminase-like domain-containing protein [Oceanobacter sp. 3_MG-2023]|uniref:transglutaminase family protein n=1 Tax=Oceanobacter sp. 3_MG-2023 TaxID=3062622 RepID=UPI002735115A|nr:DUF3488 and transglutaminase-like domain-containing protein [Oceanobacter sp. 3_MG-2023]MDP2506743.1 DUF3488 and transglutaminase-like domain-containing protein [Oceanobacter sp. 3_MG-2023]
MTATPHSDHNRVSDPASAAAEKPAIKAGSQLHMKPAARQQQIPRSALFWLLSGGALALLPHYSHLPLLFWLMAGAVVFWRWQMHIGRFAYPGTMAKVVAILAVAIGVFIGFSGQYSLESAVAFFVATCLLKVLEMRTQRDGYIVIFLCFFLAGTGFLFEQSLLWGLYGLLVLWVLMAALVSLHLVSHEARGVWVASRYAFGVLISAIPVMMVFYLLFPRISPLWSINLQSEKAISGLSEQMAPGDIASLSRSDELAFRATFDDGQQPSREQLYWRALVLDRYDGRTWRFSKRDQSVDWFPTERPVPTDTDGVLNYEIIQEATGKRWLYTLRHGTALERGIGVTAAGVLINRRPVYQRKRYQGLGLRRELVRQTLDSQQRQHNLDVSAGGNPRTREWVAGLVASSETPMDLVNTLIDYFRNQGFLYTLKPPALGNNDIDAFLFDTRLGFCAHYAGAFVYASRLAGIPARVVTGYQGGEWNEAENYLTVRQYDAHAWAEIWLEGTGWVRVDPTAVVAPDRIQFGLEQALQEEGSFMEDKLLSPGRIRQIPWLNRLRMELESVNYLWHRWVLSYDNERQKNLLSNILKKTDYQQLLIWLVGAVGLVFLVITLMIVWQRPRHRASPIALAWQQLVNVGEQQYGVAFQTGESQRHYLVRLAQVLGADGDYLLALARLMDFQLYAASGQQPADEKQLIKQLRKSRKRLLRQSWRGKPRSIGA